jgi:hypothetical protein
MIKSSLYHDVNICWLGGPSADYTMKASMYWPKITSRSYTLWFFIDHNVLKFSPCWKSADLWPRASHGRLINIFKWRLASCGSKVSCPRNRQNMPLFTHVLQEYNTQKSLKWMLDYMDSIKCRIIPGYGCKIVRKCDGMNLSVTQWQMQ